MPVRQLLPEKGAPYAELGLADPKWTDEQLLEFIQQRPILMNRPVVRTPLGPKLCRPSEAVLELLPVGRLPHFTKEDGEVVVDTGAAFVTSEPALDLVPVSRSTLLAWGPSTHQPVRARTPRPWRMNCCGSTLEL